MSDSDAQVEPQVTEMGFIPRHVVTMSVFGAEWAKLMEVAGLVPSAASAFARERSGSGPRPPRPPAEVLDTAFLTQDPEEVFAYLDALARPDRVVEVNVGAYDRTTPLRRIAFHQSLRAGPDFTGLREVSRTESEVFFPYGGEEFCAWLVATMQIGYENPLSVVDIDDLTFADAIVLLGVLDGHKASLARSLARRTRDPGSTVTLARTVRAIRNGCESRDPRWLVTSLVEMLEADAPLGAPGVFRVVPLEEEAVSEGLLRLAESGDLEIGEEDGRFELGPTLRTMASALFYWRHVTGVRDTRATDLGDGEIRFEERLLANFGAPVANWLLTSEGPVTDPAEARFRFRGASTVEVITALTELIEAPERNIPEAIYAEATSAPAKPPAPKEEPPTQPVAAPAFCEECGTGLAPGAKFCEECGTKAG